MIPFFEKPDDAPDPLRLAVGMCVEPAAAMRQLLGYGPGYYHWQLVVVITLTGALPGLQLGVDGVLLGLLISGVTTLLSVYGLAGLFWITGKPLNGAASFRELTAAMLWSMVPLVPASLIGLVLGLMGEGFSIVDMAISLFALLWTLVVMLYTVAEAQRFSLWDSFWNQTFAVGIVAVAFGLLLLYPLMRLVQYYQELNSVL